MADPASVNAFKQSINVYESGKLGLYSEHDDQMHEIILGGITLQYYDPSAGGMIQDDNMPFTSQVAQVNIDSSGNHTQDLIGEFPDLRDDNNNRLLFGANAQFFLADGIATYDNGVIKLDDLSATQPTVLGYMFGGIFSNAPDTRGVDGAVSGASNQIFEVVYTPVPEPSAAAVLALGAATIVMRRKSRMAA